MKKKVDYHNDIFGPGDDNYGRDKKILSAPKAMTKDENDMIYEIKAEFLYKIIEKQNELLSNYRIMITTPEPTTLEAEGNYMSLLLKEDTLNDELAELKRQLLAYNIKHTDYMDKEPKRHKINKQ